MKSFLCWLNESVTNSRLISHKRGLLSGKLQYDVLFEYDPDSFEIGVSFGPQNSQNDDPTNQYEAVSVFRSVLKLIGDHYQKYHQNSGDIVAYSFYASPDGHSKLSDFYTNNFSKIQSFLPNFSGYYAGDNFILVPRDIENDLLDWVEEENPDILDAIEKAF